ncbi:Hypothetical Protein FCC1311_001462 [Hondaea fermentalgiana]|uniref:Cyclodeaminase/cyclohydrolase domain-containing protein n=1 Tax=Hondaea fermentalgiana TaxID=2315210 RepID=A0A2R5FYU9_9STRA|nr:Hypothetical Protein FCC1311_001462 [Hondaea fermentalgiana]|eukprot:GBG23927.1 Hypothetical Protein FCC1311_001462 [Hondaea fermentalgiana]
MMKAGDAVIGKFVSQLASKVRLVAVEDGEEERWSKGGAAAAVAASLGAASGSMAAIYTTSKKFRENGTAEQAEKLATELEQAAMQCLTVADEDAEAYANLQKTWKKDSGLSSEEVDKIKSDALDVPVRLVNTCHAHAKAVHDFLPICNPQIISDAKVAIHLLAGGARAAYQTALVNSPNDEVRASLEKTLAEISVFEAACLPKQE